jgi:hypothetical protein
MDEDKEIVFEENTIDRKKIGKTKNYYEDSSDEEITEAPQKNLSRVNPNYIPTKLNEEPSIINRKKNQLKDETDPDPIKKDKTTQKKNIDYLLYLFIFILVIGVYIIYSLFSTNESYVTVIDTKWEYKILMQNYKKVQKSGWK